MFKYFIIILNVFYCVSIGPRRFDDICLNHGMRLYVELGESGVLTALNVSYNASKTGNPSLNATSHELCSVEIVTCPSCIVNVAVRFLDLNHYCNTNSLVDCSCRLVLHDLIFKEKFRLFINFFTIFILDVTMF